MTDTVQTREKGDSEGRKRKRVERQEKARMEKGKNGDEEKGRNCCDAVCCYRMDSAQGNAARAMMMIAPIDFFLILRISRHGFQLNPDSGRGKIAGLIITNLRLLPYSFACVHHTILPSRKVHYPPFYSNSGNTFQLYR